MLPSLLNYNNPFYNHRYFSYKNNYFKQESEKKENTNSKEHVFSEREKKFESTKNNTKFNNDFLPFKYIDNILSIIDGEDLIILGVLCLLYNNDNQDIFLIITLLLLLFDI